MNKRRFLIIIWSITLFVIMLTCFRTVKHIKIHGIFDWDDEIEVVDESQDSFSPRGFSQSLSSFSDIEINSNVLEIVIKPGDSYHIKGNFKNEKYVPKFSVQNGTLEVTQKIKKTSKSSGNNKLEITVPSGEKLKTVEIDNNVGEVTVSDICATEISVNVNVGEIQVKNADCKRMEVQTNVGEVTITTNDDLSDYTISADTDIGEVIVDHKSYKRSYSQRGNNGKKIEARSNIGEVSIN